MSEQVLCWTKRIKVWRAQKAVLISTHGNEDFEIVKHKKSLIEDMNMSSS